MTKTDINEIEINGVKYYSENAVGELARERITSEPGAYVMVRTYSAGVFAGYLKLRQGEAISKIVTLENAIRIWSWAGAASLSQLAMEGTKKPQDCRFAMPVDEVILTEAIEIIPITEKAKKSIQGVTTWKL